MKSSKKSVSLSQTSRSDTANTLGRKLTKRTIPYREAVYVVLACGFILASLMLFSIDPSLSRTLLDNPFNIYRIAIMLGAMVFLLLATSNAWKNIGRGDDNAPRVTSKVAKLTRLAAIIVPIAVIACEAIEVLWPEIGLKLVRKESWPFYRNAIFVKAGLQVAALVLFSKVAKRYRQAKNYPAMVVAILLAIVLFVMAGEELSWGQRIFGWSTPENYAKINAQSETNLHNLATQAFQNTLYFGGWLLLVALPFFNRGLNKLFVRSEHLKFIPTMLPSTSFISIFSLAFALCDPINADNGIYWGSNLFIIIGTIVILNAVLFDSIKTRNNNGVKRYLLLLVGFYAVLAGSLFSDKVWQLNHGGPTEYLEVFISLGILLWAITVNSRTHLLASRTTSSSTLAAER